MFGTPNVNQFYLAISMLSNHLAIIIMMMIWQHCVCVYTVYTFKVHNTQWTLQLINELCLNCSICSVADDIVLMSQNMSWLGQMCESQHKFKCTRKTTSKTIAAAVMCLAQIAHIKRILNALRIKLVELEIYMIANLS